MWEGNRRSGASRIIRTLFTLTHRFRLPIVNIISRVYVFVVHTNPRIPYAQGEFRSTPQSSLFISCQPRQWFITTSQRNEHRKNEWHQNETKHQQFKFFTPYKSLLFENIISYVCDCVLEWCWMQKNAGIHAFKLPSHRWCHIHICYSLWVDFFLSSCALCVYGIWYEDVMRCKMICTTGIKHEKHFIFVGWLVAFFLCTPIGGLIQT